jgi:hypothetical protein
MLSADVRFRDTDLAGAMQRHLVFLEVGNVAEGKYIVLACRQEQLGVTLTRPSASRRSEKWARRYSR